MNRAIYGLVAVALAAATAPAAMAQLEVTGSADVCGQINSLREAGNISGARDMAQQCLQALERELGGEVSKFFLPEVAGWTRTSLEQNAALGFNNVSANYTKNGITVTVDLTGGSGGDGLGGLLGGFARLGLQTGQQVRVAGLPAAVQPDGTIMVTLEDGSFLGFSSTQFDNAEAALAGMGDLVNAFPVADINNMLK